MSIVNLQRDATFADLSITRLLTWSAPFNIDSASFIMNNAQIVHNKFAAAEADASTPTLVGGSFQRGLGIFITPPDLDAVPYRIKANVGTPTRTISYHIGIGYAPASITGTDDTIARPIYLPFFSKSDELVIVPVLEPGDAHIGRPLAVAILLTDTEGIIEEVFAHLSVQNLSVSPPGFAQSTS